MADKISGLPGCLFLCSNFIEVVKINNLRNKFRFPFYGGTLYLDDDRYEEWVINKKFEQECKRLMKYIERNGLGYFRQVVKKQKQELVDFKNLSLDLLTRIPVYSDRELVQNFVCYVKKYSYYFGLGAVCFVYEHVISDWLFLSLQKKYRNPGQIIPPLLKIPYKSFILESDIVLLAIKKEENLKKMKRLIEKYIKDFFYINANYVQCPKMDRKKVFLQSKQLKEHPTQGKIPKIPTKIIKLSQEEKLLVDLLKITEIIRDKRKLCNLIGIYVMDRFLDEAIKRSKIKRDWAKRTFWFEYVDLIFKPQTLLRKLKKRKYASGVLDNNKLYYIENFIAVKESKKIDKSVKIIKGAGAARGKIKGKVRIILSLHDFKKFRKGDILVTEMTRPDFVPIMKLAKAIVTDEGSLTCHAAIVSRELGIPCIVGTKIATRVLKDGDRVEVDADRGIVCRLNKEAK
jgi:phosphohistidine swiveling domain-containing protein